MSTVSTGLYRVGSTELVPEAAGLLVRIEGIEIGVFRSHGEFRAYENRCAHQGGPVCTGVIIGKVEKTVAPDGTVSRDHESTEQIHLICPWHGWEYDLSNGECATDRRYKLRQFPVEVVDGQVFVSLQP